MSDKHTDAQGAADFRKKPVTIQAIRWTSDNLAKVIEFTDGRLPDVKHDFAAMSWENYADLVAREGLKIFTLEGKMSADIGDWIIKGVKGEHYPCKADIFDLTYERAAEGQAQTSAAVGEYLTCCDHPDCSKCAGRGGTYRVAQLADSTAPGAPVVEIELKAYGPADWQVHWVGEVSKLSDGLYYRNYKVGAKVKLYRAAPTAQQSLTAGGAVPDRISQKWLLEVAQNAGFAVSLNGQIVAPAPYHDVTPYLRRLLRSVAAAPLPQVQSEAALYQVELDEGMRTWMDVDGKEVATWRRKKFNVRTIHIAADQQPVTPSGAQGD